VRPTHEMHVYEVHARISCMCLIGMHLIGVDLMGVYLIGVYFIGVDLIGMYLMGVHLLWIISLNNLCAKLPRHANSPSPELALEIAPPIHPERKRSHFCSSFHNLRRESPARKKKNTD
jgi:hypothetical protein